MGGEQFVFRELFLFFSFEILCIRLAYIGFPAYKEEEKNKNLSSLTSGYFAIVP